MRGLLESSRPDLVPATEKYYAASRGNAPVTLLLSSRLGAVMARYAQQWGLKPTVLTLAGVSLGVLGGTVLGTRAFAGSAAVGWLLLQLAYAFDCSDGQLARVSGQSTVHGARLDVLCDFLVQGVLAGAIGSIALAEGASSKLILAFTLFWFANLFMSATAPKGSEDQHSVLRELAWVRALVRSARDYPIIVTMLVLAVMWPQTLLVWLISGLTALNILGLLATIVFEARKSMEIGSGSK